MANTYTLGIALFAAIGTFLFVSHISGKKRPEADK